MNWPVISVIIPVYKVEAYLERCIKSVVNQTYKNLEILLIDDGSPDQCPMICDDWAKKDSRVKVIHNQNGGLSSARNTGLDISTGEYIAFVDSDDWIEPEMYEVLIQSCINNETLMAVAGRFDVQESSLIKSVGKRPKQNRVIEVEETLSLMLSEGELDSVVWDKVFSKYLWDDIRFPMGEIYEDIAVMYKIVVKAKRISMCDGVFYNYFHRNGSIVKSEFSASLIDYPNHTREMLTYISSEYPKCKASALYVHIQAVGCLLKKMSRSKMVRESQKYTTIYYEYTKELKSYTVFILKSSLFTLKEKILFFVLSSKMLTKVMNRLKG